MFLKAKIIQIFTKYTFHKSVNHFSLTKILASSLVIIFFGIKSINAQIENDIYGQKNDDLAGVSSLMLAVSSNDIDGVKFFSRAGGFLINQKNIGGATALHIAARNGNLEITSILLENGADVNIVDNEGWSPLMRAAINNNSKVLELLLEKGANTAFLSSEHESALVYATFSDCSDCLNLIFTKSDLIKTMDTKLLKKQLIDAFTIARNRENKLTQNLLEEYLDRITKMTPLVVATDSETPQQFMAEDGKVKYILIDEENNRPIPVLANTTISQNALPPTSSPAIASTNKVVTKFKFVSGVSAASETPNTTIAPKKTIYKLVKFTNI